MRGKAYTMKIGPQYNKDSPFKAAARLHQSNYRATVLKVDYLEYGNRLTEHDGRALLNYYDGLGVKEALRKRYPHYSQKRDADLLRSEHIPFNMLAPLVHKPALMKKVLSEVFGLKLIDPIELKLEWAPFPADKYLGDLTSFDTYICGRNQNGERIGLGIEVKYTERGYRIGASEAKRVQDSNSSYWIVTRESGVFSSNSHEELASDNLRQIWRNHLLGLSMVKKNDIDKFISATLYPAGNDHFQHALSDYQNHLQASARRDVLGCTFEQYISSLSGDSEIEDWKEYLSTRYLFEMPA